MPLQLERPANDTSTLGDTNGLTWLDEVYEAYHRQAIGLAFNLLQNRAEAEDVVQDALIAVWRARHRYDPTRASMRTWLLTMVRNGAIDVLRKRAARKSESLDPERPWAADHDVAGLVLADIDSACVQTLLGHLPAEQLRAVELAYFDGLTHQEISARLEIPLGTVKGRLRLALKRLQKLLQPGAYAIAQS